MFVPELLSGAHYYPRVFLEALRRLSEETYRNAQALFYKEIARTCFAETQQGPLSSSKLKG